MSELRPLFDSFKIFTKLGREDVFTANTSNLIPYLESSIVKEAYQDYRKVKDFLYSTCRKSEGTFNSVRIDVERLLLWSWNKKQKSIAKLKRADIEDYVDFLVKPDLEWITIGSKVRFNSKGSQSSTNNEWKPFYVQQGQRKSTYSIKPETLKQTLANLSSLYEFLVDEDYAYGNLIPSVRKKSIYISDDRIPLEILRLTETQWNMILDYLTAKADLNKKYERTLFVIVTMKVLYLRISELCNRPEHEPTMSDFKNRKEGKFLLVFGKGRKDRLVSIPDNYIPYLMRYRKYRGLDECWPNKNENHKMLCTSSGKGQNLTTRQLRRIVKQGFEEVANHVREKGMLEDANNIEQATTHWLRHTGASMDIENNRPLKHVSEELGHASMSFTDAVYVQSALNDRARSGRGRAV